MKVIYALIAAAAICFAPAAAEAAHKVVRHRAVVRVVRPVVVVRPAFVVVRPAAVFVTPGVGYGCVHPTFVQRRGFVIVR